MRAAGIDLRLAPVVNLAPNPNVVGTFGYGSTGNCAFSVSTEWAASGATSAMLTPTTASSDSFVAVAGDVGAIRLGMVPGRTYTASATVYTPTAQAGPLSSVARAIQFYTKAPSQSGGGYVSRASPQGPVTGSARVAVTVTIPSDATEAFVRLYNGASIGNGVVYWDEIMVHEGTVVGDYFDGDTPGARWLGTPNASRSVRWPTGI